MRFGPKHPHQPRQASRERSRTMGIPNRNLKALVPNIRRMQKFLLTRTRKIGQCLIWTEGKSVSGYGAVSIKGSSFPAHRIAAFVFLGPQPRRLSLALHRCGNKPCINPDHLYWGTYQDNIRDAVAAGTHLATKKVRCKRGHLLRGANIHIRIGRTGMPWRVCLPCCRIRERKRAPRA